ncbi:unnamed protein product, partial [Polarella glacialis]
CPHNSTSCPTNCFTGACSCWAGRHQLRQPRTTAKDSSSRARAHRAGQGARRAGAGRLLRTKRSGAEASGSWQPLGERLSALGQLLLGGGGLPAGSGLASYLAQLRRQAEEVLVRTAAIE